MSKVVHVVLTGGVGSRLWPLSRKCRPKQYLDIFSGYSLFEHTINRNRKVAQELIVVGNVDNIDLSKKSLIKLGVENVINIVEATPRNTAAAIAFAAFAAHKEDVLIVTPSDHVISDEQLYKEAMQSAVNKALEGSVVTFGIKPTRPETGYGYIEFDQDNVLSFREKPDVKTAEDFIKQGNFYWNSGMFCFKAGVFLEELEKYEPEVFKASLNAWNKSKDGNLDLELSLKIPSISVDYAVMERSKKIKVVASHFEWSDLGSFESVYDYLVETGYPTDENGNMVLGTTLHTSFLGLEKCILVYTDDALMVLKKEKSQDVKNIYQQLESTQSKLL
mgnify:FL=1|jgi:mannose-1-phosphate guanylyltransferase